MDNFKFKKKYGQNFLIDENVLNNIVNNINIKDNDLIIEIGPGSGALTNKLIEKGRVLAYEIDLDTKKYLKAFNVIYDDFLKRDLEKDLKDYEYNNLYIVGNLPYYITTPIIEKIIKSKINVKEMIFMVQKEVGERLSSLPGNKSYGYITCYLNYYYEISKLFNVSRNSFYPVPNVDSTVIKLISHSKYKVSDEKLLNNILKKSFTHKRKTLLNNLKEYDKDVIKNILIKNKYNLSVRAEELPLSIFIEITDAL